MGTLEVRDCALLLAAALPLYVAEALRGAAEGAPVPTTLVPLGEVLCLGVLEEEAETVPVREPPGRKRYLQPDRESTPLV